MQQASKQGYITTAQPAVHELQHSMSHALYSKHRGPQQWGVSKACGASMQLVGSQDWQFLRVRTSFYLAQWPSPLLAALTDGCNCGGEAV